MSLEIRLAESTSLPDYLVKLFSFRNPATLRPGASAICAIAFEVRSNKSLAFSAAPHPWAAAAKPLPRGWGTCRPTAPSRTYGQIDGRQCPAYSRCLFYGHPAGSHASQGFPPLSPRQHTKLPTEAV